MFPTAKTPTESSSCTHAAFHQLVTEFGLDSSCGYVTFLRTGKPSKSKCQRRRRERRRSLTTGEPYHDDDDVPVNGLVNSAAKDLLGEELEDLETKIITTTTATTAEEGGAEESMARSDDRALRSDTRANEFEEKTK